MVILVPTGRPVAGRRGEGLPVPVHVLQVSDVHLTAAGRPVHGRDGDARLRRVLDAVRARNAAVDAVVATGDLTDDGSEAGCQRLAEQLAPFGVPVLARPGNHDDAAVVRRVFTAGRPRLRAGRGAVPAGAQAAKARGGPSWR